MDQGTAQRGGNGRSILEEVVERFGEVLAGKTAFGEPVQRNATTVIPVARVRFGFGGGLGRKRESPEEGRGGGGGAQITPVGFIVITDAGAQFQRISGARAWLPLVGVALAGWFALRLVARARA